MNDGVTSSRPDPDETLVKRIPGETVVDHRSFSLVNHQMDLQTFSQYLTRHQVRLVIVCLPKQNRSFQDEKNMVHRGRNGKKTSKSTSTKVCWEYENIA